MTPMVPRQRESRTFLVPDGSLIRALAILPRSPTFISIPQQAVPSGIFPIGRTLPM